MAVGLQTGLRSRKNFINTLQSTSLQTQIKNDEIVGKNCCHVFRVSLMMAQQKFEHPPLKYKDGHLNM